MPHSEQPSKIPANRRPEEFLNDEQLFAHAQQQLDAVDEKKDPKSHAAAKAHNRRMEIAHLITGSVDPDA